LPVVFILFLLSSREERKKENQSFFTLEHERHREKGDGTLLPHGHGTLHPQMTLTRICFDCLDNSCVLSVCPFNSTYLTTLLTFVQQQALVCVVVLMLMWDVDAGIFEGMRASQCIVSGCQTSQAHLQNQKGAVCSKNHTIALHMLLTRL